MQVEFLGPVEKNVLVRVSEKAQFKQMEYVRQCSGEVGWVGYVVYTFDEESNTHIFRIEDVFLCPQKVTAGTTDFDTSSFADFAQDLIENDPDAEEKLDKLLYWGHSHVNMGTSPSGTDTTTLKDFDDGRLPHFVVAILTKDGKFRYDVAFFREGLKFTDVPTVLEHRWHNLRNEVEAEITLNVSTRIKVIPLSRNYSYPPQHTVAHNKASKKKKKNQLRTEDSSLIVPSPDLVTNLRKDKHGNYRNSLTGEIILSSWRAAEIKQEANLTIEQLDEVVILNVLNPQFFAQFGGKKR